MIHHASFAVADPRHVAAGLAELAAGLAVRAPSPPFPHGTWFACLGDEHGSLVELLPEGFAFDPEAPLGFSRTLGAGGRHGAHLLIGTPLSHAEVLAVAAREGWRAQEVETGLFAIVKVWVEGRFLVELIEATSAARHAQTFGASGMGGLDVRLRAYEADLAQALGEKVPAAVLRDALGEVQA